MSSYLIKKDNYTGEIIYMEYDLEGYKFKPKHDDSKPYIKVNSVTIYKPEMIDHLLTKKFEKKFDRLSQIIMNFLYQDDESSDEGDFMILLDEVARLKSVVELKYQRYLQVEEYKDYIHKLAFLDNQLRQKIAIINYKNNLYYQTERGRSM
ncbi:MAG: hypothetical protein J1F35_01260 [Erysipelotrichales bacterium]|nr:hypothetical protein [Erysipelotrichales bacterium]